MKDIMLLELHKLLLNVSGRFWILKKSIVGLFSLPKEKLPNNSKDLSYCQKEYGIPYFEVEDLNSAS